MVAISEFDIHAFQHYCGLLKEPEDPGPEFIQFVGDASFLSLGSVQTILKGLCGEGSINFISEKGRVRHDDETSPIASLSECGDERCGAHRLRQPKVRARFRDFITKHLKKERSTTYCDGLRYTSIGSGMLLFDLELLERCRMQGIEVKQICLIDKAYGNPDDETLLALQTFADWQTAVASIYGHQEPEVLAFRSPDAYHKHANPGGRVSRCNLFVHCDAFWEGCEEDCRRLASSALIVGGLLARLSNLGAKEVPFELLQSGHGFLSVTMTQAWFPMHAEIWNAPTWFLSALTFATAMLPFSLPILAKQSKVQLRRTAAFLFIVGLLPKLGYCYDHQAWGFLEGAMNPKAMPDLAIFNTQRFNPFYAVIEVLLGAVACRLVMLDDAEGEEKAPKTNALSTAFPLIAMVAVIILRATGVLQLSDLLTRAVIFIPLFLSFLMAAHRSSVVAKVTDPVVNFLSSKPLVTLGNLAFPIFVIHGPLGQLFYKKVIATTLFGGPLHVLVGPQFFYAYLAIVLASAWVLQKTFLTNKAVGTASNSAVDKLASAL